jgi:hypothetical protein
MIQSEIAVFGGAATYRGDVGRPAISNAAQCTTAAGKTNSLRVVMAVSLDASPGA